MALIAVVLPAPLGPMSPRIRPSSTRRSKPSSARVVRKALRRPRASMDAIASAVLLGCIRHRPPMCTGLQQLFRREAEPLDGRVDPGPDFGQELLPLVSQQQIARAGVDEHAAASLALHELLVDELLVALQY